MGLVLKLFVKTKVCLSICYTKVDVTRSRENHCGFKGNCWKFPSLVQWSNSSWRINKFSSKIQNSHTMYSNSSRRSFLWLHMVSLGLNRSRFQWGLYFFSSSLTLGRLYHWLVSNLDLTCACNVEVLTKAPLIRNKCT